MAVVISKAARLAMLKSFLMESKSLRLFQSDTDPSKSDTYKESDFVGYAPIALRSDGWEYADEKATYPAQTFLSTKGNQSQSVFGYYVTDKAGVVFWAERFPTAPYAITNNGDSIKIEPMVRST